MILMIVVAISIRSARQSKEADTLHALVFPPFLSKKIKCKLCSVIFGQQSQEKSTFLPPSQTHLVAIVRHINQGKTTLKENFIELKTPLKENLIELNGDGEGSL
jgi:hypothetical protein